MHLAIWKLMNLAIWFLIWNDALISFRIWNGICVDFVRIWNGICVDLASDLEWNGFCDLECMWFLRSALIWETGFEPTN
jgi:hypothetical protein